MTRALMFAPLMLALSLSSAMADPARACFSIRDMQGWRAPDAKTIYIHVSQTRYFRLDLSASCSLLTFPGAHLITKTRGSDQMCSGIDWDLSVASDAPNGIRMPCIVKSQTELTPDEVAAIPKKFKPN